MRFRKSFPRNENEMPDIAGTSAWSKKHRCSKRNCASTNAHEWRRHIGFLLFFFSYLLCGKGIRSITRSGRSSPYRSILRLFVRATAQNALSRHRKKTCRMVRCHGASMLIKSHGISFFGENFSLAVRRRPRGASTKSSLLVVGQIWLRRNVRSEQPRERDPLYFWDPARFKNSENKPGGGGLLFSNATHFANANK